MTSCLKCVAGVPYLPTDNADTPSAGYHVLEVTTDGTLKTGCNSAQKPALTTTCSMTAGTTQLSLFVDYVSGLREASARELGL